MIYLIIIIVIIILYVIITYNQFVKHRNRIDEAFSTMDIYLQKRWDLIPNLVEIVKGYSKYEKETLKEIVEIRSSNYKELNNNAKLNKNSELSNKLSTLMLQIENYPDLKSSETFINLSEELRDIEDEIAQSRKYYNAVVREYNIKVKVIPSNIIAKIFKFKEEDMYITEDKKREDIKMKINN